MEKIKQRTFKKYLWVLYPNWSFGRNRPKQNITNQSIYLKIFIFSIYSVSFPSRVINNVTSSPSNLFLLIHELQIHRKIRFLLQAIKWSAKSYGPSNKIAIFWQITPNRLGKYFRSVEPIKLLTSSIKRH